MKLHSPLEIAASFEYTQPVAEAQAVGSTHERAACFFARDAVVNHEIPASEPGR